MPWSVEPSPLPSLEVRLTEPEEAHDASYLAASARISSFCRVSSWGICSLYVHGSTMQLRWIMSRGERSFFYAPPPSVLLCLSRHPSCRDRNAWLRARHVGPRHKAGVT